MPAGSGPDIAVKEIECFRQATEDDVRREAAAMEAVTSLEGCLGILGKYAGELDSSDGGAVYHLAMPCASLHPCDPDSRHRLTELWGR